MRRRKQRKVKSRQKRKSVRESIGREKNKAERAKKKVERERERMDHKQRKAGCECKEAPAEGKKERKGKDQSMQAEMQRLFLANESSSYLESSSESGAERHRVSRLWFNLPRR